MYPHICCIQWNFVVWTHFKASAKVISSTSFCI
jgi:hypothetical protein